MRIRFLDTFYFGDEENGSELNEKFIEVINVSRHHYCQRQWPIYREASLTDHAFKVLFFLKYYRAC